MFGSTHDSPADAAPGPAACGAGGPPAPAVLGYATALPQPVASLAEPHYGAAVACGALPLLAGTSALAGFVATRWVGFALLGLLTLPVGLFLFVVGCCDLLAYAVAERRRLGRLRGPVGRRVFWAAVLLLANFPVALLCAAVGLRLLPSGL